MQAMADRQSVEFIKTFSDRDMLNILNIYNYYVKK